MTPEGNIWLRFYSPVVTGSCLLTLACFVTASEEPARLSPHFLMFSINLPAPPWLSEQGQLLVVVFGVILLAYQPVEEVCSLSAAVQAAWR